MDDTQIIEQLIEAQRGLMAALGQITMAIEDVNGVRVRAQDARMESANLAVAKAIEMNTDFQLYARRASAALLERIAPTPDELGDTY